MSNDGNDVVRAALAPSNETKTGTVAAGAAHVVTGLNVAYTDTLTVVWELVAPNPLEVGEIVNAQHGARQVIPYDAQNPSTALTGLILPELSTSGVASHTDGATTRVYIMNRYDTRGFTKVNLRLVNNATNTRTARIHVFRTRPSVTVSGS